MKIYEIYTGENIGPAPKGVCSKPASQLPASWVSSCKSQGKRQRTGDRKEKVDGKTIKVCRLEQLHVDKIEYKPTDRKADNY